MKEFLNKHQILSIAIISFLLSAVVVLLSCSLASFLYPHISMQPYYNDPSTFVIMGKEMVAGKTPYIEIFDHKGLYIFYVTALYAYLGKFGIFLVMSIMMTISLVFFILALRELNNGKRITIVGLLLFTALYVFFAQFPGDADLVVMVGMIMFYFYIKGYKNQSDKYYMIACILAGISAGIALNIRPSDAMLGFAFMVFYLVKRIKEKKTAIMLRDAALCLGALLITMLPAYIHAYAGGFLNEMVDAVFISNFRYLGSSSDKSLALVWMSRLIVLAIFASIFLLWFFKRKEYELEEALFILIVSAILFVIQFGIALFAHYLISVSGFIVLAFMIVINKYKLLDENKKSAKPLTCATVFIFAISLLFNPTLYLSHYFKDLGDIDYIKENIPEAERKNHTFLFAVSPGLYLNTGINVIYPDFNAQTYHMTLSKNFNEEHMANFVQSDVCHYFVFKDSDYDIASRLMGDTNNWKIQKQNHKSLSTTVVIYSHII